MIGGGSRRGVRAKLSCIGLVLIIGHNLTPQLVHEVRSIAVVSRPSSYYRVHTVLQLLTKNKFSSLPTVHYQLLSNHLLFVIIVLSPRLISRACIFIQDV